MPAAIGFVLAGGGIGVAAGTVAGIGSVIAFQATSLVVLGAISRKLTDRKLKNLGSQGSTEREVTVRAADAYENFVYGRALVGGLTVYHNALSVQSTSLPSPNNRMVQVVKWAGHTVSSIESFRIDDRNLDPVVDSIQWNGATYAGSGFVQTGAFRGYDDNGVQSTVGQPVRIRWYDGRQTSADLLMMQFAADWDANMIGRGRAYGVFEIDQVNELSMTDRVFARGFPNNIQAYMQGKSVYDPRRWAINSDPQFVTPSSAWFNLDDVQVTTSSQLTAVPASHFTAGVGGITDRAFRTNGTNVAFASSLITIPRSGESVDPNFYGWRLHARARQSGGTSINYLTAAFYTAAGSHLNGSVSSATGWGLGTFHYWGAIGASFPSVWSDFYYDVGSGRAATIPASAAYMRIGILACYSNDGLTRVEVQELRVQWLSTSAQLVDVSTLWGWRENPALCAADYLRNEQFGFGRESRQPINSSRYALNGDPMFRRHNTLNVASYWRHTVGSAGGNPIASISAFSLALVSDAPGGRRAMTAVASGGSGNGIVITSDLFPVDPSGIYTMSVFAKQTGARRPYISVHYAYESGEYFTGTDLVSAGFSSTWSNHVVSFGSGTALAIPASARFAQLTLYAPYSYGVNDTTTAWFQEAQVQPGSYVKRYIEPWEQIDWASVSSAAAWCDGLVATPSGTQARFTCNGQGNTGRSYRDNLRDLLGSGNLRLTYTQSGFRMFGGWVEPSVTINEADILGPLEVKAAADTADRYNTVRASFYDRHNDHKYLPAANFTAAEYIARDNSMQLYEDIDLPYTNDWFGAQRVMAGVLEQGDNQMLVRAPIGWKGFSLQPGLQQAVRVRPMSWTPKYFMLTEIQNDVGRSGASAVLREDYQASYTDVATHEYVPRSGSSVSCYAPFVPQVGSVVMTSRPDSVRMRWVNPANRSFEWVDIYRRHTTNAFSGSGIVKTTRADEWTDQFGVGDNNYTYYYWFRTRDAFGSVSSIYPSLTSSFSASPLVQVANDPEYVFLEEFNYQNLEQFEQRWERAEAPPYPSGISFPQSGVMGGRVLDANSTEAWYVSRTRIPYDPESVYRITARVAAVTSRDNNASIYVGVAGFRADGTTYIDTTSDSTYGNHTYAVMNGVQVTQSFGVWREYVGHISGTMPWPTSGTYSTGNTGHTTDPHNAARVHDLTRYISPVFVLNYSDGTGRQAIDTLRVEKLRTMLGVTVDPYLLNSSNWIAIPNVAASSINLLSASQALHNATAVFGEYNTITLVANSYASGSTGMVIERFNPSRHRYITDASSLRMSWEAKVYVSAPTGANSFTNVGAIYMVYTKTGSPIITGGLIGLTSGASPDGFPHDKWATIGRSQALPNSLFNTTSYPPPYYVSVGPYVSPWASGPASAHVAYFKGEVTQS